MTRFKVEMEYNNSQLILEVNARNDNEARVVAKLQNPSHRIVKSEKIK